MDDTTNQHQRAGNRPGPVLLVAAPPNHRPLGYAAAILALWFGALMAVLAGPNIAGKYGEPTASEEPSTLEIEIDLPERLLLAEEFDRTPATATLKLGPTD